MKPKAVRNAAMVRGTEGLLRLEMVDAGREFVLDPLAELVWNLSDGSRNVEALAQAAGRVFDRVVYREEVFSALDFLADAGLIEERVAPPVAEENVSRRSLLVRIAPVVGAAAWMMSGVSAVAGGLFQYNESASKESDRKAADRESNNKESDRKAADREYDNKERDNKNRDHESDDKQDWKRQQDAEKRRKADFKKTIDEINESERKREYTDPLYFIKIAADVTVNMQHDSKGRIAVYVSEQNWAEAVKDSDLGPFLKIKQAKPGRSAALLFTAAKDSAVCVYFDGKAAFGVVAVKVRAGSSIKPDDISAAYKPITQDMLKKGPEELHFNPADVSTDEGVALPAFTVAT